MWNPKKSSVSRSMFSFQKRKVHFAFHERLVSYPFFDDRIELASVRREERTFFFATIKWFIQKLLHPWHGKIKKVWTK